MLEFTDAEIKDDLWSWNDFQDRIFAAAKTKASDETELPVAGDAGNN